MQVNVTIFTAQTLSDGIVHLPDRGARPLLSRGHMNKNPLILQAFGKFLLGVIVIGMLLFLPAGSLRFWQGWLLMGILFVPMFCAGLIMLAKNPQLLSKRLSAREKEDEQKTVVKLSGLLFIAAFVVAGFNWRLGWCVLPDWAVWVSAGIRCTWRQPSCSSPCRWCWLLPSPSSSCCFIFR